MWDIGIYHTPEMDPSTSDMAPVLGSIAMEFLAAQQEPEELSVIGLLNHIYCAATVNL